MRRFTLYIFSFLLITGCVSKKKYADLEKRHQQALIEKTGLEEVLSKVAIENDSLKKKNDFLDSVYRAEHEKYVSLNNSKNNVAPPPKSKNTTISKAVEYDKKALYVYNLPNYVFWPRTVKADKFLIGSLGESNMNAALAANVYGKKINEMPALVEPYSPSPGKFYHMIFVSESKQKEFLKLQKELKDQPVLLITENPYLEKVGAHVCFYLEGDRVKFTVNKKGIEKSGMNVSEQLIKFSNEN